MNVFGCELKSICRRSLSCLFVLLVLASVPAKLIGQAYVGTVTGNVTDSSGAVIPNANVTLTDQEKGYTFQATSNGDGLYRFGAVAPGLYTVSVEASGFEKAEVPGVRVSVNQNATANLKMKVAGGVQTVTVETAQKIDTEDATTGLVVNRKFINDLPLVSRYVMDLTAIAPGVTEADDQCGTNCTGTNFVSNGSRNSTADILMDGSSLTNYEPNGGVTNATYTPSPDSVEEFKVQQSNFSAEFGFSGGSVINMVTRSGTNTFHGTAYDFLRNQVLDANDWFANHYGSPIAALHHNNYGGTIGGPIFKNKTFFFFDWDGTRQTTQSNNQAGVPTDAMRAGDFGEVCSQYGGTFDSSGLCSVAQGQIWDPYSGTYDSSVGGAVRKTFVPFNNLAKYASPGNPKLNGTPYQLSGSPGDLIDPVAQKMMSLFPEPNIASSNGIYENWFGSGPNYGYSDQFDLKIDHRFSQNNLLSGKYSQNWNHNKPFNCFGNFVDPCAGGPNQNHAHLLSINDTHTFSPTLLLAVTFGFTRGSERIFAYNTDSGVTDPLAELGMPSYLDSNGFTGVPAIFIGGGYYSAGYTDLGNDPYGNYKQGQDTGQLTVALSKQIGQHSLKFGFEGRLHQMNYIQTNAPNGIFNFDQYGTSLCPNAFEDCGGDAMASFLTGNTGSGYYEIQYQTASQNYQYAWFAQEDWKVNNKLTVNVGLRYDVTLPRTERHNRQNWFDPNVTSPLSVPGMGALHGGEVFASSKQRTNVDTDWSDIQPRFGFAYQFTPTSVVRGGYGIYYSQSRSGANGVGSYGTQGFNQYTNMITTYHNDGATPYLHLSNPYPNGLIQPAGSSLGLMNDVGYQAIGPIRTMKTTPYEQTWSLGVEQQVPWNIVVDMEYIGKKGTHLYFGGDNQLNILGPEIENYSQDQISALNDYVPNPFYGVITDPNSTLSSEEVVASQLQVPFPQFTGVTTDVPPIANSIYHALQVTAQKSYSNGLQLFASLVWSKSIDDSSVDDDNVTWLGSFLSLQDPNKPWLERSLSTFDIPLVTQFSYTYDLPIGRGKAFLSHMPTIVDEIIGGWRTNGIWRIAEGRPLAMTMADGTPLPTYGGQRPNIVGTPERNHGHDWIDSYFKNPDVFQAPPIYGMGNAPRAIGSIRTPTSFTTNLSIQKDFSMERVRPGMGIEFRIEAQNAFNHPVFGTPDTSVDDEDFGTITYTSTQPRQVQAGLKVHF